MRKITSLLFALLLSLAIISCGGGDSGGGDDKGNDVILPGVAGKSDATAKSPNKDGMQTGTSSTEGCKTKPIKPGCPA